MPDTDTSAWDSAYSTAPPSNDLCPITRAITGAFPNLSADAVAAVVNLTTTAPAGLDPDNEAEMEAIEAGALTHNGVEVRPSPAVDAMVRALARGDQEREASGAEPRNLADQVARLDRAAMRRINLNDLEFEFTRIAEDMDTVGRLYALARAAHIRAEAETKAEHGRAMSRGRDRLAALGMKTPGHAVTAEANGDAKYLATVDSEARVEALKIGLQYLLKAIETKAKMLVGLGADQRQERSY